MFKNKSRAVDYEPTMLPKNRKEVFFDVVKLHWGQLLMLGCLALLFAAPLHIYAIAEDFYIGAINNTIYGVTDIKILAQAYMSVLLFGLIRSLINILLFALFSVGLSGIARVIRQYAWDENVDFNHDFVVGVKQNAKQFVIIALVAGLIQFVCHTVLQFNTICMILDLQGVNSVKPNEAYDWVAIIPVALCAVLLIPIAGYATVASVIYENKLRNNLKIGRVCYFKFLWKTLLACVCCLAIFAVQMIPNFWCHLVGRIVSCILIPAIMLGWYLFAFGRLDEVVNKTLHPELVNKGVYALRYGQESNEENAETENLTEEQ